MTDYTITYSYIPKDPHAVIDDIETDVIEASNIDEAIYIVENNIDEVSGSPYLVEIVNDNDSTDYIKGYIDDISGQTQIEWQ